MKHYESALLALTLSMLVSLTLIPAYSYSGTNSVHPQTVTTLSVSPPETIIWVDSFFDIYINVADVYDLFMFDIILHYDPLRMAAQSVTILPPFNSWVYPLPQIDPLAGTVHVACTAMTPPQSFSGTGSIFKISYVCLGPGNYSPLHLEGTLFNSIGGVIPYIPIDGSVTQNEHQAPPINVTFRLLAVEAYYSNALSYNFECVGSVDYAMKSAEYLISELLNYPNWQNLSTPLKDYKYTAYVHLLSNHTNAKALPYYRGPPTNSNVVNEINNFLSVTDGPWESNNLTVRILYYCGHSGIASPGPAQSPTGFFLALGDRGSHPQNASDPSNPSSYQELWDYQLNQTLCVNDLATSNCTLIILDSCRSQIAIQTLQRNGRVIMTACKTAELANGWVSNPAPWPPGSRDRWSFFTGQDKANARFSNGTLVNGPLGIIGVIGWGCDTNNDGWASAREIFEPANCTALSYSMGEAKQQTAQHHYLVMNGKIPIVQYNNKTAFPYNGRPGWGETKVNNTWPGFHHGADRTGTTAGSGASLGEVLWNRTGIAMNASIVISETEAVATACNGSVYGLDVETGRVLWEFNAESDIQATPYVDKGTIYVATLGGGGGGGGGGIVYAIDEATGRVIWQSQALPDTGYSSSPVVADGRLYVATSSELGGTGEVRAFNQTSGELLWARQIETPVKASLAAQDGLLFVAATARGSSWARLHAFSELSGAKVWNYSFGLSQLVSTPAIAAGRVIIGCGGGGGGGGGGALPGVYAFNEFNGSPIWDFVTSGPVTGSLAVYEEEEFLAATCQNGFVYTLNLTNGTQLGSAAIDPNESSPAISGDGYVYFGSADGRLYRLDKWCNVVDWYDMGSEFYDVSSPALDGQQHLIIGKWNILTIYCFGPPWPEHDVAVDDVHPQQSSVTQGDPVTIEYTVRNEGNMPENVTVTVGCRNSSTPLFGDITALYEDAFTLGMGEQATRSYIWDTTGVPADTYSTCALISTVNGETEIGDNILVNGSVAISLLGVHDVAVNVVTPAKTVVCQTMRMKINVDVANLGVFPETFHVTVTARPGVGLPITVGTQLVTLAPGETRVLTFAWLTSGMQVGAYGIEATAETVPGETYILNNNRQGGQVKVATLGDINADNIVDISDAAQIGANWLKRIPPGNPNADINDDGIIDIADAAIVGGHWRHRYP